MRQQGRTAIASLAVALLAVGWPAGSRAETLPGSDPAAAAVGPSFTCAAGQEPLAQLICSDHDLSRTDLRFVQAYQALRQQSDPAGRAALWREQVAFHGAILAECSIPATGDLPSVPSGMTACVQQAYEGERQQWLSRLSGPALEEANRPIEEHIAAQRELQAKGFLPATAVIDGVYGPATRTAIVSFQRSANLSPTGFLADQDMSALIAGGPAGSRGLAGAPASKEPPDSPAEPAVPPIAKATYHGKPVQITYQDVVVTLDRELSHDSSACPEQPNTSPISCNVLIVKGEQGGRQLFAVSGEEVEDAEIDLADATIELRHLDTSSGSPQVVFSFFTGGAHCCYWTKIATSDTSSNWQIVDAGEVDGERFSFLELVGDGNSELVHTDGRFDYAFSCYSCSNPPTQILKLTGTKLTNASAEPAFRAFQLARLHEMEADRLNNPGSEPNGYLAGWVAQKSLIGETTAAWRTMLIHYDKNSTDGLQVCAADAPAGRCRQDIAVDYPTALALFLVRNGYLTPEQSAALNYGVVQIEAQLKAKVNRWYLYLRSGACATATAPSSPAELISFDQENGLTDQVDVLESDGSGKPLIVRVGEPEAGDMFSVYMFFRGPMACEAYRRRQQQRIENLQ